MMRRIEWDVTVLGGANMDYLIRGKELPTPGETLQGNEFQSAAGGKGANQAVAAARSGARVCLIGTIGDDELGNFLIDRLNAENVDARHVTRVPTPTGIALIMVGEEGQKLIYWYPGANHQMKAEDVQNASEAISTSSVLLTQLEVPLDCVSAAIDIAHGAGAQVVLDAAPAMELHDSLLKNVNVVRANATEAKTLTKIEVTDRKSAMSASENLIRRGVGAVILEVGSQGNLVAWPALKWINQHYLDEYFLPRLQIKSVDATGAGDAFCGAFTARLAQGTHLVDAAKYANAAAALKTITLGAQAGLPYRDAVLEFLRREKESTA